MRDTQIFKCYAYGDVLVSDWKKEPISQYLIYRYIWMLGSFRSQSLAATHARMRSFITLYVRTGMYCVDGPETTYSTYCWSAVVVCCCTWCVDLLTRELPFGSEWFAHNWIWCTYICYVRVRLLPYTWLAQAFITTIYLPAESAGAVGALDCCTDWYFVTRSRFLSWGQNLGLVRGSR